MDDSGNEFVFNVRCPQTFTPDRKYRVYFRDGEFFLIRIGGQNMDMAAIQFGLVGVLIAALFRRGDKSTEDIAEHDQSHPRERLDDHKHNFSVCLSDLVESSIEPAPLLPQHGPCVGRWVLTLRDGKKWTFEFEELEQMHCAMRHLPTTLDIMLRVGVSWDDQKQMYRKAQHL